MTDEERIARGHRAANELRTTEEAFSAVRDDYIKTMLATSDQAEILRLHQCIATVDQVRKALQSMVDTGAIAASARTN